MKNPYGLVISSSYTSKTLSDDSWDNVDMWYVFVNNIYKDDKWYVTFITDNGYGEKKTESAYWFRKHYKKDLHSEQYYTFNNPNPAN